jgi:hypothetical protein
MFANKWADRYNDYAAAICLLSDVETVQGAASQLDRALCGVLNAFADVLDNWRTR